MKKHAKTIKLFLIDGSANGRLTCEMSNWSGKAYKIPRIEVKGCFDRPELKTPGVYMLFGRSESSETDMDGIAYIGEAEDVLNRLNEHLTKKDFWHEVILFISKDENLNKAHIRYLEHRLTEQAKLANRYELDNQNTPKKPSISESDRAEMEEYLDYIKILVNTLGHKILEPKNRTVSQAKEDETKENIKKKDIDTTPILFLKGKGVVASGEYTSEGFLVFKGSQASIQTTNSCRYSIHKTRSKLINNGTLIEKKQHYEFTCDHLFSSPSAASDTVFGSVSNGLISWKLASGQTLKDFFGPQENKN